MVLLDQKAAQSSAKGLGCFIAVMAGLPLIIGMLVAVGGPCVSFLNARFNPWIFPIECKVGEEILIKGRNEKSTEPFIKGNNSCRIKIVDSSLTGPSIVQGGTNVRVTVDNSTLRVTKAVLDTGSNSTLTIENGSKIHTDGWVVMGGSNAKIDLVRSTIASKGGVIKVDRGAEIRAKEKSRITSAKPVIQGDHGKLFLDESELLPGSTLARTGAGHFVLNASNNSTIQGNQSPMPLEITVVSSFPLAISEVRTGPWIWDAARRSLSRMAQPLRAPEILSAWDPIALWT